MRSAEQSKWKILSNYAKRTFGRNNNKINLLPFAVWYASMGGLGNGLGEPVILLFNVWIAPWAAVAVYVDDDNDEVVANDEDDKHEADGVDGQNDAADDNNNNEPGAGGGGGIPPTPFVIGGGGGGIIPFDIVC